MMNEYYRADQDRGKPYVPGSEYTAYWFNAVPLHLGTPPPPPAPTHVIPFFDFIRVRLKAPLDADELAALRAANGPGKVTPNRRDPTLLRIARPRAATLRLLDPTLRITSVEIATDYVFRTIADRDAAELWFFVHRLKPYHRADQPLRFCIRVLRRKRILPGWEPGCTTYTETPDRRHRVVTYPEAASRMGIPGPCLHTENRLTTHHRCAAAGLGTVADALAFDFTAFARKHLRFADLDADRFGAWLVRRGWHIRGEANASPDAVARRVLAAADHMQEIADRYPRAPLTTLDNSRFVPLRRRLARIDEGVKVTAS